MNKNIKKFFSIILSLFVFINVLTIVNVDAASSQADYIIDRIELSDYNFAIGDNIRVVVTLKNIGNLAAPMPISINVLDISGATFGSTYASLNEKSMKTYDFHTGVKYELSDVIITSENLNFTVECNHYKSYTESDYTNNSKTVSITGGTKKPNLVAEDIIIDNHDYGIGTDLGISCVVSNNSNYPVSSTEIPFALKINSNEAINVSKTLEFLPNETKEVFLYSYTVESNDLNIDLNVNSDSNLESFYGDNSFEKCFTSAKEIAYDWYNSKLGSFGYASVGAVDKNTGDVYIGTDMGDIYRYKSDEDEFEPLLKSGKTSAVGAIASICVADNTPGSVFAAVGYTQVSPGNLRYFSSSKLLRSTDKGENWFDMKSPARYSDVKGNNMIAVDPTNSNIMITGSFLDGAYITNNAMSNGVVWEKLDLPGFVQEYDQYCIISSVAFDKSSYDGEKCKRIYIASFSNGVYVSNDYGNTFELMTDSPKNVRCLKTTDSGVLYAASEKLSDTNAPGGIYKFSNDSWEEISPETTGVYRSVDVSPYNQDMICVTSNNGIYIFDGSEWERIDTGSIEKKIHVEWTSVSWPYHLSFAMFDTANENALWTGSWTGAFYCTDVKASTKIWQQKCHNLEVLTVSKVIAPNTEDADFYAGLYDKGYVKANKYEYPENITSVEGMWNSSALDYCKNKPNILITAGGKNDDYSLDGLIEYSEDYGITNTPFASIPNKTTDASKTAYFANIAVASDVNDNGCATVVALEGDGNIYRTDDYGATWTLVKNADDSDKMKIPYSTANALSSDSSDKNIFYFFNYKTGEFFVSRDNGKTFEKTADLPVSYNFAIVKSFETTGGNILLSLGENGLYHSDNYGASFKKVSNVTYSNLVGIGKHGPMRNNETIYLYGEINYQQGLYFSTDLGVTWNKINMDEAVNISYNSIDGDKNEYGIVYVGTGGHGVLVGQPKSLQYDANIRFDANKATLLDNECGKLNKELDLELKRHFYNGSRKLTLDAVSGKYVLKISGYLPVEKRATVIVNGEEVGYLSAAGNDEFALCEAEIPVYLDNGQNEITVGYNNLDENTASSEEIYLEFIKLSANNSLELTVTEAGTYPVKITYQSSEDVSITAGGSLTVADLRRVALTVNGKTYYVRNPITDTKEHIYTLDMDLQEGENTIYYTVQDSDSVADTSGLMIKSIALANPAETRRYTAESDNLMPRKGSKNSIEDDLDSDITSKSFENFQNSPTASDTVKNESKYRLYYMSNNNNLTVNTYTSGKYLLSMRVSPNANGDTDGKTFKIFVNPTKNNEKLYEQDYQIVQNDFMIEWISGYGVSARCNFYDRIKTLNCVIDLNKGENVIKTYMEKDNLVVDYFELTPLNSLLFDNSGEYDSVSVKAFNKDKETTKNAKIIIGYYDSNDCLLDLSWSDDISLDKNTNIITTSSLPYVGDMTLNSDKREDAEYLKVFLWNMDNLEPLTEFIKN